MNAAATQARRSFPLVLAALTLGVPACKEEEPAATVPTCSCSTPCPDEEYTFATREHLEDPIDYPDRPPAGGDHNACWTTWGIHTDEVPDERWVHNLEHGAVIFLYNCPAGCPDDVAALEALLPSTSGFAMLIPYSLMTSRFAAVAWRRRLQLDCLDLEALAAFHDAYVDQAPESTLAPPPPSCPP